MPQVVARPMQTQSCIAPFDDDNFSTAQSR
jgi:hypothetical protein